MHEQADCGLYIYSYVYVRTSCSLICICQLSILAAPRLISSLTARGNPSKALAGKYRYRGDRNGAPYPTCPPRRRRFPDQVTKEFPDYDLRFGDDTAAWWSPMPGHGRCMLLRRQDSRYEPVLPFVMSASMVHVRSSQPWLSTGAAWGPLRTIRFSCTLVTH